MSASGAASDAAAARESVEQLQLTATRGNDALVVQGTARYRIPEATVRRSEMLMSLSSVLEGRDAVKIPIQEPAFARWYAMAIRASEEDCTEISLPSDILASTLKAMDALGDTVTLQRMCRMQAPRVLAALRGLEEEEELHAGISRSLSQLSDDASVGSEGLADGAGKVAEGPPLDLPELLTNLPPDLAVTLLRAAVAPPGPKPVTAPAPPVVLPPGAAAVPPALAAVVLRACAPAVDTHQSLYISLRTPACMDLLADALPDLSSLDALRITVTYVAGEEPYARMLRAVCGLPRLIAFHLTDSSVTDYPLLGLASAVHDGMPLEDLRMYVMPATIEAGTAFVTSLVVLPRFRIVYLADGALWHGAGTCLRTAGQQLKELEEMHVDVLTLAQSDVDTLIGAENVLPKVHTLEGGSIQEYGSGAHSTVPLQAIVDAICLFPNLTNFALRDYEIDPPKFAHVLASHSSGPGRLTSLDLSFSLARSESDDIGRLLVLLPDLASLSLRSPPGDEDRSLLIGSFGGALATLTKLSHLDLSGTQLTVACAEALAAALPALSELVCLGLNECVSADAFGPDSAAAAVEATAARGLAAADSLRELRLEQSFLPPDALPAVLAGMPMLRTLRLSGTVLGEAGARHLTGGLMHAAGLQALRLSQAALDPPGLRALVSALTALGALTLLDLSYNQMGREGAVELAEALCPQAASRKRKSAANLPRLVVLDLSFSQLGREGLAALQSGLESLPSLRELNLRQAERVSGRMVDALRAAKPDLYILY